MKRSLVIVVVFLGVGTVAGVVWLIAPREGLQLSEDAADRQTHVPPSTSQKSAAGDTPVASRGAPNHSPPETESQEGAEVSGTVADAVSGQPLSGVEVSLKRQSVDTWQHTASDENGWFFFRNLTPGDYAIRVSCPPGYTALTGRAASGTQTGRVTVKHDEIVSELDFRLHPCTQIAGLVSDEQGNPIKGAVLTGHMTGGSTSPALEDSTNGQGRYLLEGLAPDRDYFVSVIADGFHAASALLHPPQEGIDDANFVLGAGAIVSGVIVDEASRPLPGAVVRIVPGGAWAEAIEDGKVANATTLEAKAGEGGLFEIRSVGPGTYDVRVRRQHTTYWQTPMNEVLDVDKGAVLAGVRVILASAAEQIVEGTVRDAAGRSLPEVAVLATRSENVSDSRGRGATDEEGRYRVEGVGEEPVRVEFRHPQYPPVALDDVPVGSIDADVVLARTGAISGEVVDAITRAPIGGFDVKTAKLFPYDASDRVWGIPRGTLEHGEAGSFVLREVFPGTASLLVTAPGCAPELVEVEVAEDQITSGIVVGLSKACVLEGQLFLNGMPLAKSQAYVEITPRDGAGDSSKVGIDESGQYRVDTFPVGTYLIRACLRDDVGHVFRNTEATLDAGLTTRVDFDMGGSACIQGAVSVPEGYVHSRVYLRPPNSLERLPLEHPTRESDVIAFAPAFANGNAYVFGNLMPGTYKITADCQMLDESERIVDIREDSRVVTIGEGEIVDVDLAL